MITQNNIETTIFVSTYPDIIKKLSISNLFLSILSIFLGFAVFYISFQFNDSSSAQVMVLLVAGVILFLIGIFRLFWKSKVKIYAPSESVIKEDALFFHENSLGDLLEFIKTGNIPTENCIKSTHHGGNVRLNILISRDCAFVALQLFKFVPYNYSPVTPVVYFKGEEAKRIVNCLQICRQI